MTETSSRRQSDPGGYPKGRKRRAEILQTAFEAFSAVGYRSASMVQIAADCGVSRAGLVHHFPTKEALLEAVLAERDRIDDELFFQDIDPAGDGLDYLSRLVRVVEHNASNPGIVSLFAVLSTEAADPRHPAHEYFVRRYAALRDDIGLAVADLARRGLLKPGVDPDGFGADLVALIDGLQVQWLLDPASVDMAARVRARLAGILAGEAP